MAKIELKHIYKVYEGQKATIQDFNLKIEDKEFVVFVGPSGCGKSTTLRMIAGLEEITDGELYIDGKLMNKVKPNKRDIAMVFQNYALYPHMSVYDNIAYSLKIDKIPKKEIRKKVYEAAKLLDIEGILDRKPKELSGGQKQRVAIGRTIVRKPKAFLMDEPLSNLDAKLRTKMRGELHTLYKLLQTTFIYVTHDQTEAMTLGTKIVVMKDGIVQQIASPKELYQKPANVFVAGFIGSPQINTIKGKLVYVKEHYYIRIEDQEIPLSQEQGEYLRSRQYMGQEILVGIRPEDVRLVSDKETYGFSTVVEAFEMLGAQTNLFLKHGDWEVRVQEEGKSSWKTKRLAKVVFPAEHLHFFDPYTECRI